MHSSLIGKVEKANRYARELDRMTIDRLSLTFRGDNDTHHVALDAGQWRCTCHYFESWGSCAHTLALTPAYRLPETTRRADALCRRALREATARAARDGR